ncbi:hypothetical protein Lser_V15G09711 [Lactuca serriola]
MPPVLRTQKHGVEEWNSLKKVRIELERLRLICERIIRREKLKVMIKIWVNGAEGQKLEGQSDLFSAKIAETVDAGAKQSVVVPNPSNCCSNLSSQ